MVESGKNLTGFILLLLFSLASGLAQGAENDAEEQALIRYYLQVASEKYQLLDVRQRARPFELLLVTRRFTLDSNADTLQLDTALIKASFQRSEIPQSSADTLLPDTIEILRSSYLEERPVLPALFFPPPWQGEFIYGLYPNDPGAGDIALAFRTDLSATGDSAAARDGLFLIDRSSGLLTYFLYHFMDKNRNSRSAEYVFIEKDGALVPQQVVEHITRSSSEGGGYYIVETYLVSSRLK